MLYEVNNWRPSTDDEDIIIVRCISCNKEIRNADVYLFINLRLQKDRQMLRRLIAQAGGNPEGITIELLNELVGLIVNIPSEYDNTNDKLSA